MNTFHYIQFLTIMLNVYNKGENKEINYKKISKHSRQGSSCSKHVVKYNITT